VRQWQEMCAIRPIGKGCYCFIVNEAHGLSAKVVQRLLTVLEDSRVRRTAPGIHHDACRGAAPVRQAHGRRSVHQPPPWKYAVARARVELAFAVRCRQIAQTESLDGRPLEDYVRLAKECRCNIGACFSASSWGDAA